MKFLLPTQPWKLGNSFHIENEKGDHVLKIEGNFYSRRQKMIINDQYGLPVGRIERKLFSIQPVYSIYFEKKKIATVKRVWKLLNKRIVVVTDRGDFLRISGNFESYEYAVYQGKKRIAVVSKKFFKWPNSYGLLVPPKNDPFLFLSITVAMDLMFSLKVRM